MGNLYGSLISTADSMRVFERALSAVQNNVVNADTPGYAKQRQMFIADRFDPDRNVVGGVSAGAVLDYRSIYLERTVQARNSQYSFEDQRRTSLASVELVFPVTENAGVPAGLNRFFSTFSQLTVAPNDVSTREVALDRARDVAFDFRTTAGQLLEQRGVTQQELRNSITEVNAIVGRIREINAQRTPSEGRTNDAGTQAQLYAALEELSGYVDFQVLEDTQGGVSLYLGGRTLLLIGDRQYELSTDVLNDQARVLDSEGNDVTSFIRGGKVAGLVDVYNNKLPSYLNDLNTLAATFADQVNQQLAQGLDLNGNPPTQDLFGYDATLGAAFTLQANGLAPEALALSGTDAPGGNGNVIALVGLPQQRLVANQTFQEFYGGLSGRVGRDLVNSRDISTAQNDLLAQAKAIRQESQGVSLDEEAALLIQYQRSYQAAAQLFKTINEMTQAVLNALQ
ncbi:MAG: flagellar hook-associated protein FlgK [Bryobacter sp.]|nr:flagellar hook-associated protein FlgK [Bryobacter sp.]